MMDVSFGNILGDLFWELTMVRSYTGIGGKTYGSYHEKVIAKNKR